MTNKTKFNEIKNRTETNFPNLGRYNKNSSEEDIINFLINSCIAKTYIDGEFNLLTEAEKTSILPLKKDGEYCSVFFLKNQKIKEKTMMLSINDEEEDIVKWYEFAKSSLRIKTKSTFYNKLEVIQHMLEYNLLPKWERKVLQKSIFVLDNTPFPSNPKKGDYHQTNLPLWGGCEEVYTSIIEEQKYVKNAYSWVDWAWLPEDKLPKGWIRLFYFCSFGKDKKEPTAPTNLFLYTGINYGHDPVSEMYSSEIK